MFVQHQSGWIIFCRYLMVPANSGLKAYSQSCISLSFAACSRMPRCSVHTAKVLGVWKQEVKTPQFQRFRIYWFMFLKICFTADLNLLLLAVRSVCLHCIPPSQTKGWWPLSPRCPSRCGTGRRKADAPPHIASPSRWCEAPGSASNLSLTQWGCN